MQSYTKEFKKQTLDILDNLSSSRNKWQKVADAKQVSKSLVVKWNKARNSICQKLPKINRKQMLVVPEKQDAGDRWLVRELEIVRNTPWPLNSSLPNSSCDKQKEAKFPSFGLLQR